MTPDPLELADGIEPGTLLTALVTAGVPLSRFEVIQPSLRQIFVDRVGAELAADQPKEAAHG